MSTANGQTADKAASGRPGSGAAPHRRPKAQPRKVGTKEYPTKVEPTADEFTAAVEYERAIADEAAEIRGEATTLTPELFLRLWPLLRRPIPAGFIVETSRGDGKPYDSKGIRSVQVCIDRADNVLTPLWWHQDVAYHEDGKLCEVTVIVDVQGSGVKRSAWGGVDRGNTVGNRYKGTHTNAAKVAFARLGIGREVYVGALDFDPDVNVDAAREQTKADRPAEVPSPLADVDPAELESRTELLSCAKGVVDLGLWSKQRLKAELVSAKAADTKTSGRAIASMPYAEVDALLAKLREILPEPSGTEVAS